jgi:hypothetical protein
LNITERLLQFSGLQCVLRLLYAIFKAGWTFFLQGRPAGANDQQLQSEFFLCILELSAPKYAGATSAFQRA